MKHHHGVGGGRGPGDDRLVEVAGEEMLRLEVHVVVGIVEDVVVDAAGGGVEDGVDAREGGDSGEQDPGAG